MKLKTVVASELKIPPCPLPRPGEAVQWFTEARPLTGTVVGHNVAGEAVVRNQFGNDNSKRFEELRLSNPFVRAQPNWFDLPPGGKIVAPADDVIDRLSTLLHQPIPPGPSYFNLIEEIWGRGFEVFLVGGTVRDALVGAAPNDVDLVTTMPLARIKQFLRSMYKADPSGFERRGYVRIGGAPKSGDPFIDLKVFSDSLSGTKHAQFGVGFASDMKHRDFACNAVYYDAINQVLIDPSGRGIDECLSKTLSLICTSSDQLQMAQIFIRAIKFMNRGFVITDDGLSRMVSEFMPCLAVMTNDLRIRYLVTQVTSKVVTNSDKIIAINEFKVRLLELQLPDVWERYFGADVEKMFVDAN